MAKVTYASSADDLHYLAALGVPLSDMAGRMGRSEDAIYAMIQGEGEGSSWVPTQEF